jgi:ATP-dependent Clp protease ATP-binding subunit ClpC
MFERYSDTARQAIFWAFYVADETGSAAIGPEHLLAGILGVDPDIAQRYPQLAELTSPPHPAPARPAILQPAPHRDLPLSEDCKRALARAAEESERLGHGSITGGHLLIGILRQEHCRAAKVLRGHGITIDEARTNLIQEGSHWQ